MELLFRLRVIHCPRRGLASTIVDNYTSITQIIDTEKDPSSRRITKCDNCLEILLMILRQFGLEFQPIIFTLSNLFQHKRLNIAIASSHLRNHIDLIEHNCYEDSKNMPNGYKVLFKIHNGIRIEG